jgi:branched-chain amino acid transport system substrate-binding protein
MARGPLPRATAVPIRVGVALPISGNAAGLAGQELLGIRIAAETVNADGGIGGRPIQLDVRDLETAAQAPGVMADLRGGGAAVVVGGYSSDLSIAASTAAADAGLVYWESGAVADRLTGRGLPLVFRVGASGANLGSNSAAFAATQLPGDLGRAATSLRLAIVAADDDYASSVADAAAATAKSAGVPIVERATYDLAVPDWSALMTQLKASRPDVVILASHVPDGIQFRRAMIAANLRVGALIGSTMAECDPDFAGDLGSDAVGVFASDRPTGGFEPGALGSAARLVYTRFAAAWRAATPAASPGRAASPAPAASEALGAAGGLSDYATGEYTISGPVEEGSAAAGPSEEGLSGFSAAWALFRDVLPSARGSLDAEGIAAAARSVDLPVGALPNGAGLKFSTEPATLGQNERAAAVIWQWQAVRSYAFVWPSTYATAAIRFVPLGR